MAISVPAACARTRGPKLKVENNDAKPQKEAVIRSYLTNEASLDEFTLGLKEENRLRADYKEMRRYQFITVVRQDHPSVLVRDLGPASDFVGVPDITIPSVYGEDTVGELMNLADEARARSALVRDKMAQIAGESKLIETFMQMGENADNVRKARSTMGRSGHMIQRSR